MIARVRNTANMAISSFNYLLVEQVMCHVTPGFPANPLPALPLRVPRREPETTTGDKVSAVSDPGILSIKNFPKRQKTETLCQFDGGQIRRPVLSSNAPK